MVKLFSILVLHRSAADGKPTVLANAFDLSSVGYFFRGSAQEFLVFFSKTMAERTQPACRQSVREKEYMGHVYTRLDNLCGVVIADQDYPTRVVFTLLNKVLDEFAQLHPAGEWSQPGPLAFPKLPEYLKEFQNPQAADTIMKLQKDLDETKIILHGTIESLLERGRKLDDLIAVSEDLSAQSKGFYQAAKKTNSCCVIL